jgi:tripeptidyl-peptidase-1
MKLGLAGVTILYSSGDYGVAGLPDSNGTPLCCTNPGCAGGAQSTGGIYFNPTFPSTCPYVTSVGATQMAPGSDFRDPEIVCQTVITSSGGFSNIFPLPSYQAKAVAKYYKDHKPNLSGL